MIFAVVARNRGMESLSEVPKRRSEAPSEAPSNPQKSSCRKLSSKTHFGSVARKTSARTENRRTGPAPLVYHRNRFPFLRRNPRRPSVSRWLRLLLMLALVHATFEPHPAWAQRSEPVKIGVLTESWGPTPGTIGLRDGLRALGYREGEHLDIGV